MADDITIKDGFFYGGWRRPKNASADHEGSIHDDNTAKKIGFDRGLVPGNVLLEVFPPLALKAFGQRWFENGSISMYFGEPIYDNDECRGVIGVPPEGAKDAQVAAWIENREGRKCAEGTIAIGSPDLPSALRSRSFANPKTDDLRILAGINVGDALPNVDITIAGEPESRIDAMTDPHAWYKGGSPWGGAVSTPRSIVRSLHPLSGTAQEEGPRAEAVGLDGAIEIRFVNGPLIVGETYQGGGAVAFAGQSPKTEFLWHDITLDDKSGKRVMEMRKMSRFMKASSPLYQ